MMRTRPTTDAALWDYVHRLFGIGDWDEDCGVPFWKYRAGEAMKVKAKRLRLHASVSELVVAADFCKALQIDIRNVAWLYKHIPNSSRWMLERERALSLAAVDELIEEAVHLELAAGPGEWSNRLIRATGEHRLEVYESWKAARGMTNSPE